MIHYYKHCGSFDFSSQPYYIEKKVWLLVARHFRYSSHNGACCQTCWWIKKKYHCWFYFLIRFMARCDFLWQYCLPPAMRIIRVEGGLAVVVGSKGIKMIEEPAFFLVLDLILRGRILDTETGFRTVAMMSALSLSWSFQKVKKLCQESALLFRR